MLQLTRQLGSFLYVQLRINGEAPSAFRIAVRRLYALVSILSLGVLLLATGFLFFFRELEINRKLVERVLELETAMILNSSTRPAATIPKSVPQAAPQAAIDPRVGTSLGREPTALAPVQAIVPARMNDLIADCNDKVCDIHTYLIPVAPGTAEGSLALVLEEEISRIGGADPNTPPRRQFVYYPGFTTMEEFDVEKTAALERKHFRFARALPTNVQFPIGKLNQPIAINLYIFDNENNLVHHERKTIEHDH